MTKKGKWENSQGCFNWSLINMERVKGKITLRIFEKAIRNISIYPKLHIETKKERVRDTKRLNEVILLDLAMLPTRTIYYLTKLQF